MLTGVVERSTVGGRKLTMATLALRVECRPSGVGIDFVGKVLPQDRNDFVIVVVAGQRLVGLCFNFGPPKYLYGRPILDWTTLR